MKAIQPYAFLAALFVLLPSCESPELAKKRDAQTLEITRLRGELAMIEEKLKNLPEDRSEELAKVEAEAVVQQEEVKKLEAEVADLESKKRALDQEFEDYKRKYVIR